METGIATQRTVQKQTNLTKVLKVLANPDALDLFIRSEMGVTNADIGNSLSRKRFYCRIEQLKDRYLIHKVNGEYRLTTFGKHVLSIVKQLNSIDRRKCKLIDVAKASGEYTDSEIQELEVRFPYADSEMN